MKHKNLALCAVTAALLCAFAPLSLPMGAIPVSLATMILYVIAGCVEPKISLTATAVYILLGCAGLPVFSGFSGGIQTVTGITGGFILGYLPCTVAVGLLTNKFRNQKAVYPISMILGTVLCYLCGTLRYMAQTNTDFVSALSVCILPFLIADAIKISVASTVCITARKSLKKILN